MNDVGSMNFGSAQRASQNAPQSRESTGAAASLTKAAERSPVKEPSSPLMSQAAAESHQVSEQIANTIYYTAQAVKTTTAAVLESGTLLNVSA